MLKKLSKILLIVLLVFIISSPSLTCLAHEDEEHDDSQDTATTTQTNEETEPEIYNGDLYLSGNDIVMDKLVDGNVFIFGKNVEITGDVNGNLFVFADNVKFNNCTIIYSIYACANSVYYDGGCYYGDVYVAANSLEMTFNSYVYRDLKAIASNIVLKTAVGRDADVLCTTLNLGEGTDISKIYGNLRYTSLFETNIPEGAVEGIATYTSPFALSTISTFSVIDTLINLLTGIVTLLVIYYIIKRFTPNFAEKLSTQELTFKKLLKSFGIGILAVVIFALSFVILLITSIGSELAFILLSLFTTICLISVPLLIIIIANIIKPILKIDKNLMFYVLLALVAIILEGLTLIPYIGILLSIIIAFTSLGLFINMFLPHKVLSEEEKLAIEEAKKIKNENKEKHKQEKLELKATKKQAKLEAKEKKIKDKKPKEKKQK